MPSLLRPLLQVKRHLGVPCLRAASLLILMATPPIASAWTLTLAGAPRRVYLQVGNGVLWGNSAQVNRVSVTVPAPMVGTGARQTMISDSTQSSSPYDNYPLCSAPTQVYIGASYQRSSSTNGPASAVMQVTSQPNLTNAAGDTIAFSQISWTVSTLGGDATPSVIPPGTFTGGTQALTSVPANRFVENCHTFSYANSAVRAAGTYNGQVTYTLSTP